MNTAPHTLIPRNFFFCLVLLPSFISSLDTKAAAQSKATCLINNKVTYNCDLSKIIYLHFTPEQAIAGVDMRQETNGSKLEDSFLSRGIGCCLFVHFVGIRSYAKAVWN